MSANVHDRIEALAGAIALGEASDDERREYREHIATCHSCLRALGGEREIERVAATVSAAREDEVWQPQTGDPIGARGRKRSKTLMRGAGVAAFALAVSFGVHALLAASVPHLQTTQITAPALGGSPMRIVLEQQPTAHPVAPSVTAPRRLIVTHNIVQLARAPIPDAQAQAPIAQTAQSKPRAMVSVVVHPQPSAPPPAHRGSAVPIWRRSDVAWRTVARTTTTSVSETAPQSFTHSAESLQIANLPTREVSPLGGETAINPQPPMIAYDEGAEGTTVFEVLVDEHGTPTRCVITKSAGYPVLDDAVCKAAMNVHYLPKLVDGRAVPGTYHDAFTFRMSDETSANIQGVRVPSALKAGPVTSQPIGPAGGTR